MWVSRGVLRPIAKKPLPAPRDPRCEITRTVVRPNRWAAEPAGERPYGLRPYELKQRQTIISAFVTDQMGLSADPLSYQRLRDLKAHILERRRHSGSLFKNGHNTAAQFARGVRWLEFQDIQRWRKQRIEWLGVTIDKDMLQLNGFQIQGIADATQARQEYRRARGAPPLRERQKPGRKPIGDVAMTNAQYVARHRAKLKATVALLNDRPGGAAQPLPLEAAASPPSYDAELEQMIATSLLPEYPQAERYYQYLSEILDRLKDAPPDYVLTRAEFRVIATAAALLRAMERKELH
jgi:hypothetical protein